MKLLSTINKNLKLLFRSKETAYTIIFGPILIILLVSFAFTGVTDQYTIRVGTYAPVQTSYSEHVVSLLNEKNYLVSVFPDQDGCVESVKTGATHACIVFSDREAGNGTVPVTFYLDLSRTNIIYQIADDLSGALDVQANAIREQLATDALTRMRTASELVGRNLNSTQRISDRFAVVNDQLVAARSALTQLSNETVNTSGITTVKGYQNGLAQNTRSVVNFSTTALDKAVAMMARLDQECTDCGEATHNEVKVLRRNIDDVETRIIMISQDTTKEQLFEATVLLDDVINDLAKMQAKMDNETIARKTIIDSVNEASKDAEKDARELRQVVVSLNYTKAFLDGQQQNANAISTPISTNVVSVTVTQDRLSFSYPYLLVLVIMFIGMLLASSLIVADKTSRAAFRNFTTPTSDAYHIIVSFVTSFFLLVAETVVLLVLSALFVAQPLLLNPFSTIVIICIAIMLFTFIGMIIGYLSRTQEAAMIASISVGSILLFISNLIIPVEGMVAFVQAVSGFNPYMVLSELLRRSMLYGVTVAQASREILLLVVLAVVLLGVTVLIQRRIKSKYFRQEGPLLLIGSHVAKPLDLGGKVINDEAELLDVLDRMTRADFEKLVTVEDNLISRWAAKELRNKRLAKGLRTTSKEKMMLKLDEHLEKHGKHLKR